jgi:hypothetical protein
LKDSKLENIETINDNFNFQKELLVCLLSALSFLSLSPSLPFSLPFSISARAYKHVDKLRKIVIWIKETCWNMTKLMDECYQKSNTHWNFKLMGLGIREGNRNKLL